MGNSNKLVEPSKIREQLERKITDLEEKLEYQINKFTDISRIGTVITSIIELDRILPMVMESALTMVRAEVGQMVVFDEDGGIADSVCWGITQNVTESIKNQAGLSLWKYIIESSSWLKLEDLSSDPDWRLEVEHAHINSLVAAPLFAKNRIVGAIVVANKIDGDCFDEDDDFVLETIARFAAVAVENSTLYAQALLKQKLDVDLDMARQLQHTLMPEKKMIFDGLKVNAYNTMAMQVGGDFYDVVPLSRDKYLILVADVSNKGFPAALLMATTRGLIRAFAHKIESPAELAAMVNNQLSGDSRALKGMFVTMIMIFVDLQNGVLKAVNAGHPPAWISGPDGKVRELKTGGTLMGQFEGFRYSEEIVPLKRGSRIFLYTDGAFESLNSSGKMLGISGLKQFFEENRKESPETFLDKITELLKSYGSDPDRIDDTTLLIADVG